MKDALGREIEYLRLSVIEKCNLRCAYCNPDNAPCRNEMLTAEDFEHIVNVCVKLGINKVRVTGGEPLMRKDLEEIISRIAAGGGIADLCMTTNAQGLSKRARDLKQAGLQRINISMDSLKPEKYRQITGGGNISDVLDGIDLCVECGLLPVKLNAVLIRGVNDDEVDDFIALTKDRPIEVRFIELMPFGKLGSDKTKIVSNRELIVKRPWLKKIPPDYESQPAENYVIEGYQGKIGFISPMSHKFCSVCNRIRITSDGMMKPCLGSNGEINIKEALRAGKDELMKVLREGIYAKPAGHNFEEGFHPERGMNRIGG